MIDQVILIIHQIISNLGNSSDWQWHSMHGINFRWGHFNSHTVQWNPLHLLDTGYNKCPTTNHYQWLWVEATRHHNGLIGASSDETHATHFQYLTLLIGPFFKSCWLFYVTLKPFQVGLLRSLCCIFSFSFQIYLLCIIRRNRELVCIEAVEMTSGWKKRNIWIGYVKYVKYKQYLIFEIHSTIFKRTETIAKAIIAYLD